MDIRPGTPDSPEADSGFTIPASQTSAPVQIDQVLGTLQTNTREDLQKLLVGYGEAINGEPQEGEDDDQEMRSGAHRRRGAEQVARLLGRLPARHGHRQPGPAGHGGP